MEHNICIIFVFHSPYNLTWHIVITLFVRSRDTIPRPSANIYGNKLNDLLPETCSIHELLVNIMYSGACMSH